MNLQECGAVAGDTVLCTASDVCFYEVGEEYLTYESKLGELVISNGRMGTLGQFVVVKPASGWLPVLDGQGYSSKYEFSYHNGIATHYRVVTPLVEVVEERVKFNENASIKGGFKLEGHYVGLPNATLKGETHDGKPVGVWTITMDEG